MDFPDIETGAEPKSLADRLRARKEQKLSETVRTTLPDTGLTVTYPAFIGHDRVMAAAKIAGKNRTRIGAIVCSQVCTFAGEDGSAEKLTADQFESLLPNADANHLIARVLADEDDGTETTSGN